MDNWKNQLKVIFIIFFSIGIFKIFDLVSSFKTEDYNNKIINDYSIKLKSCLDLENKNKRRANDSLKLIEYCIKALKIE